MVNSIEQSVTAKVVSNNSNQSSSVNDASVSASAETSSKVSQESKVAVDTLQLSQPKVEQLLSKALLSSGESINFSNNSVSNGPVSNIYSNSRLSVETIQEQYLEYSKGGFSISEGNFNFLTKFQYQERIAELSSSLISHSKDAHTQVTDILSNLGQLDTEAKDYLTQSEYYIEGEVSKLEKLALAYKDETNYFTFELKTQEGDTVFIKYKQPEFNPFDIEDILPQDNFSITVDGDISEEEQKALEALYGKVSEFIEDNFNTMQSKNGGFSLDRLDLSDSFDNSILTGFEITMQENNNQASYNYQIDNANKTQTLTTSLSHNSKSLSYDFSLTTGLNQQQDNGQLAKNIEQLKNVLDDTNGSFAGNSGLNQYLLDSYSALFTNTEDLKSPESEKQKETQAAVELVNDELLGLEMSLPSVNLMKISRLMDFEFSLSVSSKSGQKSYDTKLDMSQTTNVESLSQTTKVNQSKQLNVDSTITTQIPNSLDAKVHSRDYQWQQTLSATLDQSGKLSDYKAISKESIEDIKQRSESSGMLYTDLSYKENSEALDLKVLDDIVKITKSNTTMEENKSTVRFKEERPITLSHDKQIAAYTDVQSYKLPNK
ncbi:hypothetical protein [uncultured Psychrosphaera sp.]|uniref:hypothetical protein n=1 Tax=uncultured Psychrosphaera sp. TaxID=1403522 RepID=UPI0026383DF7|nr:hypothetical protein [uncultured Psychrosphaera sp.]